jgi:transposase
MRRHLDIGLDDDPDLQVSFAETLKKIFEDSGTTGIRSTRSSEKLRQRRGTCSFPGRRGDLIKVLRYDGEGCAYSRKRLEHGRFVWLQAASGTVSLTRAQLSMLLERNTSSSETECKGAIPHAARVCLLFS